MTNSPYLAEIKITENGEERELLYISFADITLKDVADVASVRHANGGNALFLGV